jgi:hypothetical protein
MIDRPEAGAASRPPRLRSDALGAAIDGVPEQTGPAATVRAGIRARVAPAADATSPPGPAFAAAHVARQPDGSVTVDARLAVRAADVIFPNHARPQRAAASRTGGLLAAFGFLWLGFGHDALNPGRAHQQSDPEETGEHVSPARAAAHGLRHRIKLLSVHGCAPLSHATDVRIVIHLPREWSENREALHRNSGATFGRGIDPGLGDGTGEIRGKRRPLVCAHQRCSLRQSATHASQTSAMTASAVRNASATKRSADVGRRTSAARGSSATTPASSSDRGRVQLISARYQTASRMS